MNNPLNKEPPEPLLIKLSRQLIYNLLLTVVVCIETELIRHSCNTIVDKGYNLAFLISCKAMDFSNMFQDGGAAFLDVEVVAILAVLAVAFLAKPIPLLGVMMLYWHAKPPLK